MNTDITIADATYFQYAVYDPKEKQFLSVWQSKSLYDEWTMDVQKIRHFTKENDALKHCRDGSECVVVQMQFNVIFEVTKTNAVFQKEFDDLAPRFRELYLIPVMSQKEDREFVKLRKRLRYIDEDRYYQLFEKCKAAGGQKV